MKYSIEKPPLEELSHYGVKGMKWGVKKAVRKHYDKQRMKKVYPLAKESLEDRKRSQQSKNSKDYPYLPGISTTRVTADGKNYPNINSYNSTIKGKEAHQIAKKIDKQEAKVNHILESLSKISKNVINRGKSIVDKLFKR